jgi:hypothetical protein
MQIHSFGPLLASRYILGEGKSALLDMERDFASRVGHRLASDYEARLNISVYDSLLDLVAKTASELNDLKPQDGIDVQSFGSSVATKMSCNHGVYSAGWPSKSPPLSRRPSTTATDRSDMLDAHNDG